MHSYLQAASLVRREIDRAKPADHKPADPPTPVADRLRRALRQDPHLAASVLGGDQAGTGVQEGQGDGEAHGRSAGAEEEDLGEIAPRREPKCRNGGEEEDKEDEEDEEVELDPDTMMPIKKGQKALYTVGEDEEEEEELDPDTLMPVKKKKGAKPAPMRQFVSYRARKLTGWTPPQGAKLICVDDDDVEQQDDHSDTMSEASVRRVSCLCAAIEYCDEHAIPHPATPCRHGSTVCRHHRAIARVLLRP